MILPAASSRRRRGVRRLCAILVAVSIAALAGCVAPRQATAPPAPLPAPAQPPAPNQLSTDKPEFLRLPGMATDKTPLRVGVILPLSNATASTRVLAGAMLKAAELALFDSGNRQILLIVADDDANPADAAAAATKLLDQGAEVIVGPLFASSVSAVAPVARDRGVPVIAFSTDRSVAGDGVYLLSFQPQTEVRRIVSYAASQGHKSFAALVPQTAYGDVVEQTFRDAVSASGGTITGIERFNPGAGFTTAPADAIAKTQADAIFIAQGGALLRGIAPTLVFDGVNRDKVKFLGPGLWDDPAIAKEETLAGSWFAAPQPDANDAFNAKYRGAFGNTPPELATLAYDAISLIALLAQGEPYHRFTTNVLTDPNGFAGVSGIFRFRADGTIERGLAVLAVTPGGFTIVSPAPKTFQPQGS